MLAAWAGSSGQWDRTPELEERGRNTVGFNYPDVKSPGTQVGSGGSAILNLRTNFWKVLPLALVLEALANRVSLGEPELVSCLWGAQAHTPCRPLVSSMASDPQISHLSAYS